MKTLEQAAQEYAAKERTTRSEQAAFIAGAEFAQRWISVEEDLPDRSFSRQCLWKDKSGYIWYGCAYESQKPTHWLPIELK